MPEDPSSPSEPPLLPISPVILIRLGSILFAGLMLGHMSGYPWASTNLEQQAKLVDAMKSVNFVFAGEPQTYWNLYTGWGILVAALLLSISVILWQISSFAAVEPRRVGLITGATAILSICGFYISFIFFYIPPTIFFAFEFIVMLIATIKLLSR